MKHIVKLIAMLSAVLLSMHAVQTIWCSEHITEESFFTESALRYVYIDDVFKSVLLNAPNCSDLPALKALIECIDQNISIVPIDVARQALLDLKSDNPDEIECLLHKIEASDPELVIDTETARKRCKQFNKLCVRGNVLICGNLLVCKQICGITCDPSSGNPGPTGNTGPTGAPGTTGFTGNQGALGARGLQGATGDTGPQGATGLTGFTGLAGNPGAQGDTGITGITGFTGFTGFTGPQGASGLSEADQAFAYIYGTGATSVTGESGFTGSAAVPFETNGAIVGITHVPGSGEIMIERTGTYEITFNVNSSTANLLGVWRNNTPLITNSGSRFYSGSAGKVNSGTVVANLIAGDVITVRNETISIINNPPALLLNPSAGPNPAVTNITASILIRQFA